MCEDDVFDYLDDTDDLTEIYCVRCDTWKPAGDFAIVGEFVPDFCRVCEAQIRHQKEAESHLGKLSLYERNKKMRKRKNLFPDWGADDGIAPAGKTRKQL